MKTHKPNPTFKYLAENQIPVGKTLVISCADPRSDPTYILNLKFAGPSLPLLPVRSGRTSSLMTSAS